MNVHAKPETAFSRDDAGVRHDWTRAEALAIHDIPLMDLLFRAQTVHRRHFDANRVQMSRLLSIKTGGCAEDCGYCSQSAHHESGLKASKLMEVERVLAEARKAKEAGATRYCMGAAWREPKERDMDTVLAMVEGVKAMGMETCMTLGMLTDDQVVRLRDAGLDYYNHNVDTSERFYPEIIKTRTYADRLNTLERVRAAGMKVCSGGIMGMGEETADRMDMLVTLANLSEHPESVPINMLIAIPGTPLEGTRKIDPIAFVRVIATARIMMPKSMVRLSAGRTEMSDEMQAMCFFAGANSIFCGDVLLTADNPGEDKDAVLFAKLGMKPMELDTSEIVGETSGTVPSPERAGMHEDHERALKALAARGRLRALAPRRGIDFSSNDYLGLGSSVELAAAISDALVRGVPVGAGGSRLLRGNDPEHQALEDEAAQFFGRKRRSTWAAALLRTRQSSRRCRNVAISSSTTTSFMRAPTTACA